MAHHRPAAATPRIRTPTCRIGSMPGGAADCAESRRHAHPGEHGAERARRASAKDFLDAEESVIIIR